MKTAVEELYDELCNKGYFKKLPILEFQQAKQLEKEQIMKAAKYMYIKCKGGDGMPNIALKDLVEKYYNETYNI